MAEFEIWLVLQIRNIISRWLWCTTCLSRPMKRHWSTSKMSRIPKLRRWSINTLTFSSDMKQKRLFSFLSSTSRSLSPLSWCRDLWTFLTRKESMELSCWCKILFIQILHRREKIKREKFTQHSHIFLRDFSQIKNARVDRVDEEGQIRFRLGLRFEVVQKLQDDWGSNHCLWQNVSIRWGCGSRSWAQQVGYGEGVRK